MQKITQHKRHAGRFRVLFAIGEYPYLCEVKSAVKTH